MANFSITEYKQAFGGVIAGMVLAFFGVDGYRSVVDPRPDPFTGTDADFMERRINHRIIVEAWNIKKSMPPEPTRKRIKAIEYCLEHNCQNFQAPTTEW